MNPFSDAISRWAGFYGLAGGASATLAGLLFVAVSLHIDVMAHPNSAETRAIAQQTLTNFVYLVSISLIFLVPNAVPASVGLPLLCIGVFGSYQEIRLGRRIHLGSGQGQLSIPTKLLVRRLFLPFLSFVVLALVALFILTGQTDALYWSVAALILILLNATMNSWDILIRLAILKETRKNVSASEDPK